MQTVNVLSVCEFNRIEKSCCVNTCVDVSSLLDRDSLVSVDSGFWELAGGGASRVCDDRELFSDDLFGSLVDSYDDSDTLKILITHFNDILKLDVGDCPRLPRMVVSKQFQDIPSKVNYRVELIVSHQELSLRQCMHLLYGAARTVIDLLPPKRSSLNVITTTQPNTGFSHKPNSYTSPPLYMAQTTNEISY